MMKKKIHYYKCWTKGCKFHKNAKQLNDEFMAFLEKYTLKQKMMKLFRFHLEHILCDSSQDNIEVEKTLKLKLSEIEKKIFNIGEQYCALREMSTFSGERGI